MAAAARATLCAVCLACVGAVHRRSMPLVQAQGEALTSPAPLAPKFGHPAAAEAPAGVDELPGGELGIEANLSSAAESASEAAALAAEAQRFAVLYRQAKAKSRQWAEVAMTAAAAAAEAATESANESVVGARTVAEATGDPGLLDDARLEEMAEAANAAAALAAEAAANASHAIRKWRVVEAAALAAAQGGLNVSQLLAARINDTVESSRIAAEALARPVAAAERVVGVPAATPAPSPSAVGAAPKWTRDAGATWKPTHDAEAPQAPQAPSAGADSAAGSGGPIISGWGACALFLAVFGVWYLCAVRGAR